MNAIGFGRSIVPRSPMQDASTHSAGGIRGLIWQSHARRPIKAESLGLSQMRISS